MSTPAMNLIWLAVYGSAKERREAARALRKLTSAPPPPKPRPKKKRARP